MEEKRYYWLKLKRDFFKRHDIRIVEDQDNGKEYSLFYLKLLVESVDHDGALRFNELIPYDDGMLATITNTNIDIVHEAMELFTRLGMITVEENGTIIMNEVKSMIGSAAGNDNAIRQSRYRAKNKDSNAEITECVTKNNATVTDSVTNSNESKSKSIDNSIVEKTTRFVPPTLDEVRAYCDERGNDVSPEKFVAYYESNGWRVGKNPMKNWKAAVITWERSEYGKPVSKPATANEFAALAEMWGDEDE